MEDIKIFIRGHAVTFALWQLSWLLSVITLPALISSFELDIRLCFPFLLIIILVSIVTFFEQSKFAFLSSAISILVSVESFCFGVQQILVYEAYGSASAWFLLFFAYILASILLAQAGFSIDRAKLKNLKFWIAPGRFLDLSYHEYIERSIGYTPVGRYEDLTKENLVLFWSRCNLFVHGEFWFQKGMYTCYHGIQNLRVITDKDQMVNHLFRIYGETLWQLTPKSYVIPINAPYKLRYSKAFEEELGKSKEDIWILKHPKGTQGRSIHLLGPLTAPSLQEFTSHVKEKFDFVYVRRSQMKRLVVQKYIHNPFTFQGKKIDFRVYVLVGSIAPTLCYYHSGIVRLCPKTYDVADLDFASHLTNTSLHKEVVDEKTWIFMHEFEKLCPELDWRKVEKDFIQTLRFVLDGVIPILREEADEFSHLNKFHLLGADFLIDANHKAHLLEINHGPLTARPFPKGMMESGLRIVLTLRDQRLNKTLNRRSDVKLGTWKKIPLRYDIKDDV